MRLKAIVQLPFVPSIDIQIIDVRSDEFEALIRKALLTVSELDILVTSSIDGTTRLGKRPIREFFRRYRYGNAELEYLSLQMFNTSKALAFANRIRQGVPPCSSPTS